ncbi:MAG: hypothetical protein AAF721_36000 [Myxococcota bacterium]
MVDSPTVDAALRAKLLRAVANAYPAADDALRDDLVQRAAARVKEVRDDREESGAIPAAALWKAAYETTVAAALQRDVGGTEERHAEAVRAALRSLNADRRRALGLRALGHSETDTGRLLGFAPKHAKAEAAAGLAGIRSDVGDGGEALDLAGVREALVVGTAREDSPDVDIAAIWDAVRERLEPKELARVVDRAVSLPAWSRAWAAAQAFAESATRDDAETGASMPVAREPSGGDAQGSAASAADEPPPWEWVLPLLVAAALAGLWYLAAPRMPFVE